MAVDYNRITTLLEREALEQPWGSDLPVSLEDRPFKEAGNSEIFIAHSIVYGAGDPVCLGGERFRYPGIQYLRIFHRGDKKATIEELASKIVNYFNLRTIQEIVFRTASTVKRPRDADGFSQLQVVCPFYFDC